MLGLVMFQPPESVTVAVTVAVSPGPDSTREFGDSAIVAATCCTTAVAVPDADPEVAVIAAEPLLTAVTSPAEDTDATWPLDDDHVTLAPDILWPF